MAAQHFHRDEMSLAVVSDVDDRDDVRVMEARSNPRLVQEHDDEVFVALELGSHELERDEALGSCPRSTQPHAGHAPFGNRREDLVLAVRIRAHGSNYFFAPFLAGFAFDQTPSMAPAGSMKIPMTPFFPMSIRATTTFAPAFSAFAIVFLTSSTST